MDNETISMLAFEVEAERATRRIKKIIFGWGLSVVILAAAIIAVNVL